MANRANHYEAAFEARIRALRVPCVAVDEAKRAISGEVGVKNPDFLLYPGYGPAPREASGRPPRALRRKDLRQVGMPVSRGFATPGTCAQMAPKRRDFGPQRMAN